MPGLKKFMLGGLDLKSNDLVRDPMRSSSLLNVTKTQKGDIDKRGGYSLAELFSGGQELEESLYYKTNDEDVFVKSDGTVHKLYNGARQNCSISTLFPNVGCVVKNRIVSAEYLSNLYITTADGNSPVVKYDGSNVYLAGMPAPTKKFDATDSTISSAGAGYYYRFFYTFKDLNGNITYGPYKQMISTVNNATITVSTFKTANPYGDFFNKYLRVTNATTVITALSNTLPYSSTNYIVGDKFLFDKSSGEILFSTVAAPSTESNVRFLAVTITAIGGGNITFSATDIGTNVITVVSGGTINIDARAKLNVFISTNPSFGYKSACFASIGDVESSLIVNNDSSNMAFGVALDLSAISFEDFYNEDGQKLRPPLCKYLASYGDQLVYGNIVGAWDQVNVFTQYNNDDLITYSDFGFADNGENNSANLQKIGDSFNGSVTGLIRCNDVLLVTKDNSIYALDGVLEPGGYSLRNIPTNYIGSQSHNALLQIDGGVLFHGNDGVYFTDGVSCKSMSTIIDPFFNTIITTQSKSTINSKAKKFLFYMTDGVTNYCLVYDYEFKEWFVWDSLDMSKGLYETNNKTVKFAKANSLYSRVTAYSDAGVAISNNYKSNWEDLRNPSLDKKFKSLRVWNLTSAASSFNLKIQKNWVDTDLLTVACSIPAYGSIQKFFDQKTLMAIRFVFENNNLNEGMPITAYEIEYEGIQAIDKGN